MHKICICGTFSSGKTTLFNDLLTACEWQATIPDQSRSFKGHFPFVDWSAGPIRDFLFLQQCFEEAKLFRSGGYALLDTGVVECFAHTLVLQGKRVQDELLRYHLEAYSYVLLCSPIDVAIEDDGLRHTDKQLRDDLHGAIISTCKDFELVTHELVGTRDQRLAEAKGLIDGWRTS